MVKTYEIVSGKTKEATFELWRMNMAMADIDGGKNVQANQEFVMDQICRLKNMGCEIKEWRGSHE